jgi:hypothetical protein
METISLLGYFWFPLLFGIFHNLKNILNKFFYAFTVHTGLITTFFFKKYLHILDFEKIIPAGLFLSLDAHYNKSDITFLLKQNEISPVFP